MSVPSLPHAVAGGKESRGWRVRCFLDSHWPALESGMGWFAANLALCAVYLICGDFGLSLAYVHASVSAVWPPTGLALAALLIWGYRLWPGVLLGAFLVNILAAGSAATSAGIAIGNTCEALAGAWLVNRFAGGANAVRKTGSFFTFVVLAGLVSTSISPSVGVTSLCLGGLAHWNQYGAIWLTWWLGDMVSDFIIAPLLLIWVGRGVPHLNLRCLLEAATLVITVVVVGLAIFLAENSSPVGSHPLTYLALLPLLWAAFRFGERGAVTSAFVIDGIALGGTLMGWGPFASSDLNQSLLFLQAFIGTVGVTAVALALAVSERKSAEKLLLLQCTVSRQLGEASSVDQALPRVLESLCSALRFSLWEVGAFWSVDANAKVLRCSHTWHVPRNGVSNFEAASRKVVLPPAVSLPGRIWASGETSWIPDLQSVETNCPRVDYARQAGLHGACAFPIRGSKECLGVIELYTRVTRPVDAELMKVFLGVGGQIGQFIERTTTEERLALVIQGSSDGIWDWDLASNEVYYSDRWKSMLGYADDEIECRFSSWERLVHPGDRERALTAVRAYLEGHTSSYEVEHRLRHKDGSYRWILSRGVALRDAWGRPVRMAGSHVDLTAHKQTEERLRQAYAELSENESSLKAALRKLQAVNEELKATQLQLIHAAKLESVGTLAAGVAHEVKNPLQTILMGLDYLDNKLKESNEENALVLGDMRDAVTRANNIIREMLQRSAAADFEPSRVDLNQLVERSLWLINNEVIASQITVVRKLGAELPELHLDRSKMEQVFINLFLNALQAMAQGGVLSVTTRRRRFGADLRLSGPAFAHFTPGEVVVIAEVQDTGKGIPEANLPKIFDPFFTTKPNGVGTGLGLSVVKKIMDLQRGAIDIRNAPLGGVVVTLVFKTDADHDRPEAAAPVFQSRSA